MWTSHEYYGLKGNKEEMRKQGNIQERFEVLTIVSMKMTVFSGMLCHVVWKNLTREPILAKNTIVQVMLRKMGMVHIQWFIFGLSVFY